MSNYNLKITIFKKLYNYSNNNLKCCVTNTAYKFPSAGHGPNRIWQRISSLGMRSTETTCDHPWCFLLWAMRACLCPLSYILCPLLQVGSQ